MDIATELFRGIQQKVEYLFVFGIIPDKIEHFFEVTQFIEGVTIMH